MSLSTAIIADIRTALNASPLATTVVLAIKTSGSYGANQTITAVVSSYKRSEIFNEMRRSQSVVQAILVRPTQTPSGTVQLGDKVTYGGDTYNIVEIQNTAIYGWICERSNREAVNRTDAFRAEGG